MKACRGCGVVQPLTEFGVRSSAKDGRVGRCLTCTRAASRARWQRIKSNPVALGQRQARQKATAYGAHVRRTYGLSDEEYDRMLHEQAGACFICRRTPEEFNARGNRLVVDHDHATGEVRGLLCPQRNMGLAGFRDRPNLLWAAISYLDPVLRESYTVGVRASGVL